jgi:DNA-binding transcriptional ArsR family regulator
MLPRIPSEEIQRQARLFAVLGDSTRLEIVTSLVDGEPRSIKELTEGFQLSRQAVTKHLRLLQDADIVINEKSGRESLFSLRVDSLTEVREMIQSIENQWAATLGRLKTLVET